MCDLTCISGMTDFDVVAQWLVPLTGPVLPGGESPTTAYTFFAELGKLG
jgi:hypothetical protein